MRVFLGPVEQLGHPFYPHPMELVVERQLGDHEVYCASRFWMDVGPDLEFGGYPPEVVAVWDPMWLTEKQLERMVSYARAWDAPVIGIMADWFSGISPWNPSACGTKHALALVDGIVSDSAGIASMRKWYGGPAVHRSELHSYGRLLERGGDWSLVEGQDMDEPRSVDVGFVGRRHERWVPLRPLYLEAVAGICGQHGWTFMERADVLASELESVVSDCKVTFNLSPGWALNIRVYEALACGSALVTEGWNPEAHRVLPFTGIGLYSPGFYGLTQWLRHFLDPRYGAIRRRNSAKSALSWLSTRTPEKQWLGILAAVEAACPTK